MLIPGAKLTVTNIDTSEVQKTSTNDSGSFELNVSAGSYSITIDLAGWKCANVKKLVVEKDKLTNIEIILEPTGKVEWMGVVAAEPSLIDTPSGTTIISGDLIRRLPHQK